jgi:prefoldin subunit 5
LAANEIQLLKKEIRKLQNEILRLQKEKEELEWEVAYWQDRHYNEDEDGPIVVW